LVRKSAKKKYERWKAGKKKEGGGVSKIPCLKTGEKKSFPQKEGAYYNSRKQNTGEEGKERGDDGRGKSVTGVTKH